MRITLLVSFLVILSSPSTHAQGTIPTFTHTVGPTSYTLAGRDPSQAAVTTIPTLLVPITLSFAAGTGSSPFVMDAAPDVPNLLRSPIFANFPFPAGDNTQYADALLRATFPSAVQWHTLLGSPQVHPVTITVPAGSGYVLTSRSTGQSLAIVDVMFLQKELFRQLRRQDGRLVIAITRNVTFYADGDATECCSWGTHGVDSATGNSFVLGSYLHEAPAIVQNRDVQPLTQQLAEFLNDPLHDPLLPHLGASNPGNIVPRWMRLPSVSAGDQGRCGGARVDTAYFLLEPTDTSPKNNIPASNPFVAHSNGITFHLQNAALLPWYTGPVESPDNSLGSTYSFPDPHALASPALPCPARRARSTPSSPPVPVAPTTPPNGHKLIGYWVGHGSADSTFPLADISPQWDIILVAFATPKKDGPEGVMQFHAPAGLDPAQFKAQIAALQHQGKKVMISLGGGGEHFTLAASRRIPNFVSSVAAIVKEYGFDGIDIDFESPSLSIAPGDTDFKHPTTPSIVNLISALRQLHDRFGPRFMISLVPEGTQVPAGLPSYGGQFGSELPIAYAIRDILSFIDVQDYNTPPLQGLDGEIYQAGSVDYHAAITELLLHGFNIGGDPHSFFPPLPADQVAVGFLTPDTTPHTVMQSMDYLITGKAPAGTSYKLRNVNGYPALLGAMFWTIDDDRRANDSFSNTVGPQLHSYPAPK
jgi:chitinase